MKFFGPHRPERVLLRRNTLYIYANEFAAWKTFCLFSSRIRVQNSGKLCHAREKG